MVTFISFTSLPIPRTILSSLWSYILVVFFNISIINFLKFIYFLLLLWSKYEIFYMFRLRLVLRKTINFHADQSAFWFWPSMIFVVYLPSFAHFPWEKKTGYLLPDCWINKTNTKQNSNRIWHSSSSINPRTRLRNHQTRVHHVSYWRKKKVNYRSTSVSCFHFHSSSTSIFSPSTSTRKENK